MRESAAHSSTISSPNSFLIQLPTEGQKEDKEMSEMNSGGRVSVANKEMHAGIAAAKREKVEEEDRLSGLPETLISSILSLLPTKNAVATSSLSKNWKLRWTDVLSMDFEDELDGNLVGGMSFVQFVDRVMQNLSAKSIRKFRLSWNCNANRDVGPDNLTAWLNSAIDRKVRVLELDMLPGENAYGALEALKFHPSDLRLEVPEFYILPGETERFDLPSPIYAYEALQVLKLKGTFWIEPPKMVCFQNLAELELSSVVYESVECFHQLISACSVLKSLVVERKHFRDNLDVCTISSPSLKRLCILFDDWLNDAFDHLETEIKIDAPALEYLRIYDTMSTSISIQGVTLVNEEELGVLGRIFFAEDGSVPPHTRNMVVDLVQNFNGVKFMNLWSNTMNALRLATNRLSVSFEALVKLVVQLDNTQWRCLVDLIDRSSSLSIIDVKRLDVPDRQMVVGPWSKPVRVPTCLASSLKQVIFRGVDGLELEMAMLKFLLNHGLALEKVCLYPRSYGSRQVNVDGYKEAWSFIIRRVSNFPIASPTCTISDCAGPDEY